MFEKILVCLDGSSLAEGILPYALEQAQHFHSKVVLLRVIKVPGRALPGEPELVEKGNEPITAKEDEVVKYLDNITISFNERGLDVDGVIISAQKPDVAIITFAKQNEIDLIALAAHGYSTLEKLVWGSISESVVRKSGLPVLVLKV